MAQPAPFWRSLRAGYPASVIIVAATAGLLKLFPSLTDAAVALFLVLAVFLVARVWESGPGVLAALLATLAFNFLFLPPFYTLTIEDPRNVAALFVFLAAALLIGRLSALSRRRLREREAERRDLVALTELSQAFLADTNRATLLAVAAERLRRALDCRSVALFLPAEHGALRRAARSGEGEAREELAEIAFQQGNSASFPSREGGADIYLPVAIGLTRIGALAALGMRASERMAEGCAALLGLAIEREKFLQLARETEQARARDEMRSTMLATLAHDLKTPLASASAAAENWETRSGASPESALARANLARLTRLTDDLLKVVRLEAGMAAPVRETVSCAAVVEAAVARFGELLASHSLFVEPPPPDWTIRADPAQAGEALGLGLENAARYSPPKSEIRISVATNADGVHFRVDDAGPGIAPADRARVMEKFVQLPSGSPQGFGLGLYIARSLAELNGGRLRLAESPSGGTRFELTLPRASGPAA